jgi:gluconolactonase
MSRVRQVVSLRRAGATLLRVLSMVLLGCLPSTAQDFSLIKVDAVADKLGFTEGPAWSKDGYLIFSDTPSDRLFKWVPGHAVEVFREKANGPSGNAFDTEGRLYTCETRTRRVTRADKSGAIEVVADKFEGKRFNAPNDVVVSKTGNVYFTDPAFGYQSDSRELDFFGVYHVAPKGGIKLVAKPTGRPNGIALSPNGKVLYVSNSDERNVRAYDIDKNGDTSNERVLVAKVDGIPGGIRVDEKGDLFVAATGIAVYSPEGRLLHTITVHGAPSNCAFGEADLKSLMITARGMLYRARMEVKGAGN